MLAARDDEEEALTVVDPYAQFEFDHVDFVTADTHFGHARIGELADRPFETLDEMNSQLVSRWNSMVEPGDTVLHLGDLALGPIEQSISLTAQLNGRRFLVPGNHDRVSPATQSDRGIRRFTPLYEAAGWTILPGDHLPTQPLSKALYGSAHMHAVIIALDSIDGAEFSAPEIASVTGLAASSVHVLISRRIRVGVIARVGGLPGERPVLYRKTKTGALRLLAHMGDPDRVNLLPWIGRK